MNHGFWHSITQRWFQRRGAHDDGVLGIEFIMAELRRARRFSVPFSVAYFSPITHPSVLSPEELAERIYPELREFDYVAVDELGTFVALWMFGTPREGAQIKAERLKMSPALVDVLSEAAVGIATFPTDGMTYEALMDAALAETAALQPQHTDQPANEGAVRWQPSLPTTST